VPTHVYRLLRTGQVRINGKRCKPDTRIATGDLVRVPPVRVPEPRDPGQAPERLLREVPTWVVFEDRHYLVFNKPSGIAAHGGSGVSFGAIELLRQARPMRISNWCIASTATPVVCWCSPSGDRP
jgi:23S rRNA pseudouridine955/2504/2580 synthase